MLIEINEGSFFWTPSPRQQGDFCNDFYPDFGGDSSKLRNMLLTNWLVQPPAIACGCFQKIGVPPKWMVYNDYNGKPYFLMDDLGGTPTIFGSTQL